MCVPPSVGVAESQVKPFWRSSAWEAFMSLIAAEAGPVSGVILASWHRAWRRECSGFQSCCGCVPHRLPCRGNSVFAFPAPARGAGSWLLLEALVRRQSVQTHAASH